MDRSAPLPAVPAAVRDRLHAVRHLALDMDGTIYRGCTLFPSTGPFLAAIRELGIGCSFLTNNPTRSASEYRAHLARMGVEVPAGGLYTATEATIDWLRARQPGVRRLFALGTPGLLGELAAAGFTLARDDPADEPDAVVVGFDTTLAYDRVCRAAWWIQRGRLFVATNPDRVCPTDKPTVLVDCGAICAMLHAATGRGPDVVLGKPDPAMLNGVLVRHGLDAADVAVVGDRLYTDMLMARRAGALGVLVLTGESTADDAARADPPPDLVVPTLAELGVLLRAARAVP